MLKGEHKLEPNFAAFLATPGSFPTDGYHVGRRVVDSLKPPKLFCLVFGGLSESTFKFFSDQKRT